MTPANFATFVMDSFFSIIGLLLTSASAIWLLAHDIKERDLRGNKLQKRNDLLVHRESMRRLAGMV
jgi:hypothetical protein